MFPSFLAPRVDRLDPDGEIRIAAPAAALGRFLPPLLLISRAHCTFQALTLRGLSRREARRAADLHAVGAAPYARAGHVVVAGNPETAVWFWDEERIAARAAIHYGRTRPLIRPETLAQPPGDGPRIVKLEGGYEAQAWVGDRLVASAWRRDRFDSLAWRNFIRAAGLEEVSERPPEARTLPMALTLDLLRPAGRLDARRALPALAAGVAGLLVLAVLFLAGQALRLEADTRRLVAETGALEPAPADPAAVAASRRLRAELAAFEDAAARTSPLSAAEVVVGISALHDLTPSRLDIDGAEVELALPYSALARTRELTADFMDSGYFETVRPRPNAEARELVFLLELKPGLPPLSADG